MEYDVFISCKSEDYKYAEEIYYFLKENGFTVFLANKELRQMGDSEYRKAISQALKSTYHLIVFASNADYIDSTWVYYEWDWFLVAKLKGKKQGQLLSILKDINIGDVNGDLWKYESKSFDNYKDSLIEYVETPSYLQRKEEAEEIARQEAERLQKHREEEQRKEEIKRDIEEKEKSYEHHKSNLDALAKEITESRKQIGVTDKKCPVCRTTQSLESSYCKKCGWSFNPVFETKPNGDKDQIFLMQGIWNAVNASDSAKEQLKSEVEDLEVSIREKEKQISALRHELSMMDVFKKEVERFSQERDAIPIQLAECRQYSQELTKELKIKDRELQEQKAKAVRVQTEDAERKTKSESEKREIQPNSIALLACMNKSCRIFGQYVLPADSKFCPECGNPIEGAAGGSASGGSAFVSSGPGGSAIEEFTVGDVTFKMIRVEGAPFKMGATAEQKSDAHGTEEPVHDVTLDSYYIGDTQVTQALWKAVMGTTPTYDGGWESQYDRGPEYPAYRVSWNECQTFLSKLNALTGKCFRLPTEAEWEFAARGGAQSKGYKYSGSNTIYEVAWYDGNSEGQTHPVKKLKPNELGLYDMSGNVYEWCQDWYGGYSSSGQTDPKGPSSGTYRVSRGGCWRDSAWFCRSSSRRSIAPDDRSYGLGLRLCLSEL